MGKKKLMLYGETEVNRLIHVVGEESRTTSLLVAEKFGKRHKNVLQAIEKLECSGEFNRLNFQPISYLDEYGRTQPMYEMTRDGFSLLTMGFTGKKAMEWKERYISCFNRMEQEIRRLAIQHANADWQAKRLEGKVARRDLTDAIAAFETYSRNQNPAHKHPYYENFTVGTYKALYALEKGKLLPNFRDLLDGIQLIHLGSAESIVTKTIWDEMAKGIEYHTIYQIAKGKISTFADAVGKSIPGQNRRALQE